MTMDEIVGAKGILTEPSPHLRILDQPAELRREFGHVSASGLKAV